VRNQRRKKKNKKQIRVSKHGLHLGDCFLSQNKLEKAIAKYWKVTQDYPDTEESALGFHELGQCYYKVGKFDAAALAFRNAISNPNIPKGLKPWALFYLGDCYRALKKEDEAVSTYDKVLAKKEASENLLQYAQYMIGLAYQSKGDYKQAVVEYQKSLLNYPDLTHHVRAVTKFCIARCYEGMDNVSKAEQEYKKIIDIPDTHYASCALLEIGRHYRNKGKYEEAIDAYKKVVELKPDSRLAAIALSSIARCYFEQQEYDKAISEQKKIIENYPFLDRKAIAQFQIGFYYWKSGKYTEGIEALQKAIDTYPDNQNLSHKQCKNLIAKCKQALSNMEAEE